MKRRSSRVDLPQPLKQRIAAQRARALPKPVVTLGRPAPRIKCNASNVRPGKGVKAFPSFPKPVPAVTGPKWRSASPVDESKRATDPIVHAPDNEQTAATPNALPTVEAHVDVSETATPSPDCKTEDTSAPSVLAAAPAGVPVAPAVADLVAAPVAAPVTATVATAPNDSAAETRTTVQDDDKVSAVDSASDCGSETLHSDSRSASVSTVETPNSSSADHDVTATEIEPQVAEDDYEPSDDEAFVYPETEEERARILGYSAPVKVRLSMMYRSTVCSILT